MDQRSGREDDVAAGADDAPAAAGDDLALNEESRIAIVLVFLALNIDVRAKLLEQFGCGRIGVDVNQIDALQGGQAQRAQIIRNHRAVEALVDLRISADADDQHVAVAFGELEIVDVAWVNDVEAAVA